MMALSRREIVKDVVQQSTEAAVATTGHITAIVFRSIKEITTEIGTFGTEIFEIRESGKRAGEDAEAANPRVDP